MEFWDVLDARHSIRDFTDEPVERATIERLVHAASLAPSAENKQPWRFHVATGEARVRIGQILAQATVYLEEYLGMLPADKRDSVLKWFSSLGGAPVVIGVSMADADSDVATVNNLLSVGAAVENLLLAATADGLGACNVTFGWWVRDELASAFNLESGRSVTTVIVVGWPSNVPPVAPVHGEDILDWYE